MQLLYHLKSRDKVIWNRFVNMNMICLCCFCSAMMLVGVKHNATVGEALKDHAVEV